MPVLTEQEQLVLELAAQLTEARSAAIEKGMDPDVDDHCRNLQMDWQIAWHAQHHEALARIYSKG